MINKIYSFLGIAQKAGKVISGEFACERGIRRGEVFLLLISKDASGNTKKKFINKCKFYEVDYLLFGQKEQLGRAIGKKQRSVVAVTDLDFSSKLSLMLNEAISEEQCGGGLFG